MTTDFKYYNAIIQEGGNAITNSSSINQENVSATIADIYENVLRNLLGLPKEKISLLGSTGKKLPGGVSGDIDIAIDVSDMFDTASNEKLDFKKWLSISDIENKISKQFPNIQYRSMPGILTFSFGWPISNTDGKQENEFVQVDLMPTTNMNFSVFSKFTPQETTDKPQYKSTIRNAIITALARVMPVNVTKFGKVKVTDTGEILDNAPIEFSKYSYDFSRGLNMKHFASKKEISDGVFSDKFNEIDKTFITANPSEIVKILFGDDIGVTVKDVEDVEGAWNSALKVTRIKNCSETRQMFFDELKKDLEKKLIPQHIILPKEIADTLGLPEISESLVYNEAARAKKPIDTKREPITKINQLTGSKLKEFICSVVDSLDKSEGSLTVNTTPKIDGNSIRLAWIGNNKNNSDKTVSNSDIYVENSYTGMISAEEVLSNDTFHFPPHIRDFFVDGIVNLPKFSESVINDIIPNTNFDGIKIIGELLANNKLFVDDPRGTITYIGTEYDAAKLGKFGTIVIFDIKGIKKSGDDINSATLVDIEIGSDLWHSIIGSLQKASHTSGDNIVLFDLHHDFAQEITVKAEDFPKDILTELRDIAESLKNSGMKTQFSRELTEHFQTELNAIFTKIFKERFNPPDKLMKSDGSSDNTLEGVVFELLGKRYGVTYTEWKEIKEKNLRYVTKIQNFVKEYLIYLVSTAENSDIDKDDANRMTFKNLTAEIRGSLDKYNPVYKKTISDFYTAAKNLANDVVQSDDNEDIPAFVKEFSKYRADRDIIERFIINDNIPETVDLFLDKVVVESILESEIESETATRKRVAFIIGSFRPPHRGHFEMIKHYANLADEVWVGLAGQTTKQTKRLDKFSRSMPEYVAGEILKIYCNASPVTRDKVKISLTKNLIAWIMTKVSNMKNCDIILGVSDKDGAGRYSYLLKSEKFKQDNPTIQFLPPEDFIPPAITNNTDDNKEMSSTLVRDKIDDREFFEKNVAPVELSPADRDKVFNLMNPQLVNDGNYDYPTTFDKSIFAESCDLDITLDKNIENSLLVESEQKAFPDVESIQQEFISATVKDFGEKFANFADIKYPEDIIMVGSTGKKLPGNTSGDIDIGVKTQLAKNEFFKLVELFASEYDTQFKHYPMFGVTSIRWPIIDSNSENKETGKFVQIDINPHENLDMLSWGMYQSPEKTDYSDEGENESFLTSKSILRALLLQAIVEIAFSKVLERDSETNEPVKLEYYKFIQNDGLFKIVKERKLNQKTGKRNKTFTRLEKTKITDNPQEIVDFIFGRNSFLANDLLTVKSVWDAFTNSSTLYKNNSALRNDILTLYKYYLDTYKVTKLPAYMKFK